MKRTFAFMMALVLVLSLSVTAFAAGTDGSITITNAINDTYYKLYMIFEATYTDTNGDGTAEAVAYKVSTSSPIYTYMFVDDPNATTTDGIISNGCFAYNTATGAVTKVAGAQNSDIFAYLTDMIRELYPDDDAAFDTCYVAKVKASNQTAQFSNLAYGYYLIDKVSEGDKAKVAVTVDSNTPTVNVIDKNQLPGELSKKTDKPSAKVGDTINWTVGFTAVNYDKDYKVLSYTIKDTQHQIIGGVDSVNQWADVDLDNIVVKVGEKVLTKGTEWSLNEYGDAQFEIVIPWVDASENFLYDATVKVEVTYSAVVLENAATSDPAALVNKNEVELDWESANPDKPDYEDETETEVYNMGFTKVDGADHTKTLSGATFGLYSDDKCTMPIYVKAVAGTEGVYIVDKDTTDSNLVVTPDDGQVVIMGLAEGTYYLKETVAPNGYNLLAGVQNVTVGAANSDQMEIDGTEYVVNNAELTIENNSGVELPSTGGEGTMMLITFGTIIAMAFAVLLITHKKMSIYHD